jgi:hypothetical protein
MSEFEKVIVESASEHSASESNEESSLILLKIKLIKIPRVTPQESCHSNLTLMMSCHHDYYAFSTSPKIKAIFKFKIKTNKLFSSNRKTKKFDLFYKFP